MPTKHVALLSTQSVALPPTKSVAENLKKYIIFFLNIDVLKALKDENIDPLDDCFQLLKPAPAEDEKPPSLKGILIFFHGSPDQGTLIVSKS